MNLPREQWVSALNALPESELAALVRTFPNHWKVTPTSLPQEGLGLLKLQDSALGDPFYLGEFSLTSCSLQITTGTGEVAEGAALLMDDRIERAEQMALCDAVLSAKLPGWELVATLIEKGQTILAQTALDRKNLLAKTRVDFSLLDDAGEADA